MRAALFALTFGAVAASAAAQGSASSQACPSGSIYCASGMPDRVVLTPGADPARQMAVAWRTDSRHPAARLEIVEARPGPDLETGAVEVRGETTALTSENGTTLHHQARLDDLKPDTLYAYRVRGKDDWSEWFQFRTAADRFQPFSLIYLGDMQSDIRDVGSRVVRQAFRSTPSPAVVMHAGDLVQQRDGDVHDDEWGEWFQTGGYNFASVPQIVAAGNHEYLEVRDADGQRRDRLGPHWRPTFALPRNGAPGVEDTTYFVDYQGARIVVLDGASGRDQGTLEAQAQWLDEVLARPGARWKIVLTHQPFFTCARPNDPHDLNRVWRPVVERHAVDLVLQGHDHCYSRITDPDGGRAGPEPRHTPVYVVSVAGGKMYALNDRAPTQTDRFAEDVQLYQRIDVEAGVLRYRAFTATGDLYDALDIVDGAGGRQVSPIAGVSDELRCGSDASDPDRPPCTAR